MASQASLEELVLKTDFNSAKKRYKLTEEHRVLIEQLLSAGDYVHAGEVIRQYYIYPVAAAYQSVIQREIYRVSQEELTEKEMNKSKAIVAIKASLTTSIIKFIEISYIKIKIYKALGLMGGEKKQKEKAESILSNMSFYKLGEIVGTINYLKSEKYNEYLNQIQEEYVKDRIIRKMIDETKKKYDKDILKTQLRNTEKERKRIREENQVILDSIQAERKKYRISQEYEDAIDEEFENMDVDSDRKINQTIGLVRKDEVMEYYQRSFRKLKTGKERVICKHVLGEKKYGLSLVALNMKASLLLNIPYLEEVKSNGGLGNYCRHSVRPVSDFIIDKINKAKINVAT